MLNRIFSKKQLMPWIIFGAALMIRLLFIATLEDRWYFYDTVHYHRAAVSLLEGKGFGESLFTIRNGPQAYGLEPIYPLFLGAVYKIFGVSLIWARIVQAILNSLICIILYQITNRIFGNLAAVSAAVMAGLFPYLIFVSGMLYPTDLGAFFIVLTIFLLTLFQQNRSRAILFAGSLAYGVVVQIIPVTLLFILFVSGWFFLRREYKDRALGDWKIWMLGLLLMITPWTVRNYRIFHRFVPIRALTNTFDNLESKHKLDKLYHSVVTGDTFTVETRRTGPVVFFDCYVNSRWVGTLRDSAENMRDTYAGVLISGGVNARIDQFLAGRAESARVVQDDFNRSVLGMAWSADSLTVLSEGALINREAQPIWGRVAINWNTRNMDRISMIWGEGTDNQGVDRAAIVLLLDSESADSANGYMVWRNPRGYLRLWRVENGLPAYHVALVYEKHEELATESRGFGTYFLYFLKNPGDFLFKYVFELVHFWNPWPDRLITSNAYTSKVFKWIGFTASILLLLSALTGISTLLRNECRALVPLLLFVAAFNIGYAFFMTQTRYQIPIQPLIMVLSGHGIQIGIRKFGRKLSWKNRKLR